MTLWPLRAFPTAAPSTPILDCPARAPSCPVVSARWRPAGPLRVDLDGLDGAEFVRFDPTIGSAERSQKLRRCVMSRHITSVLNWAGAAVTYLGFLPQHMMSASGAIPSV